MTSISAGHIILTLTQPVGSGRPQRGSSPGPPDQESRALPTELPRPLISVRFLQSKVYISKVSISNVSISKVSISNVSIVRIL